MTGSPTLGDPVYATTQRRILLSGVDVLSPSYGGVVVAVGDSITDGDGAMSVVDTDQRYPDHLQRRIHRSLPDLSVVNAGISANQVTQDASLEGVAYWGGPSLQHRFDRDVLGLSGVSGIVLLEGINDLGLSGAPPEDVIAGLASIARRAHAAGKPIAIGTLLPMAGALYDSETVQRSRAAVNAWIRRQQLFDRVVDFDRALRDPEDPSRLLPVYDSGDHLHPSPAGYARMAALVASGPLPGACPA